MNKYFKILYPLNLTNFISTSNMTMVVDCPNWVYKIGTFLPKSDQTKRIFEFSRSDKNIGLVKQLFLC